MDGTDFLGEFFGLSEVGHAIVGKLDLKFALNTFY